LSHTDHGDSKVYEKRRKTESNSGEKKIMGERRKNVQWKCCFIFNLGGKVSTKDEGSRRKNGLCSQRKKGKKKEVMKRALLWSKRKKSISFQREEGSIETSNNAI